MSQTTFADLNLQPQMLTAIEELGFTAATDVQAETIPLIRTGVDILAQSQTGTGKTMAFAIPAVELVDVDDRSVQVLILSPTRELAQQCGDEIRKLSRHMPHIKTADVYGGADFMPQFRALKQANMVIGTPGRVMDHMRRDSLDLSNLKMIILDEADEMLNMGFKEDIETILM
ncbi:MAG: DEAD/DEAH box helicase, partial [Eubacteriales bacterium]